MIILKIHILKNILNPCKKIILHLNPVQLGK